VVLIVLTPSQQISFGHWYNAATWPRVPDWTREFSRFAPLFSVPVDRPDQSLVGLVGTAGGVLEPPKGADGLQPVAFMLQFAAR
jgi:hypothetical protein